MNADQRVSHEKAQEAQKRIAKPRSTPDRMIILRVVPYIWFRVVFLLQQGRSTKSHEKAQKPFLVWVRGSSHLTWAHLKIGHHHLENDFEFFLRLLCLLVANLYLCKSADEFG